MSEHDDVGERMHSLCAELFPICRSITGDGVRATLDLIGRHVPIVRTEVPSGNEVLDWIVPKEWNVRAAHITGPDGRRYADFANSNLHLVSYSHPVRATLSREELAVHLHSLPDRPTLIPYRTNYYGRGWGFCLAHDDLVRMPEGEYEVMIDTSLDDGSLTYAECVIPGTTSDEVLLSTHVCHPSLCNDNLSGIALLCELAQHLLARQLRYTYRLLFIPGTIGSIAWLARNADAVARIRHGMVIAGVGDPGGFTWKRSRRGDTDVDRTVAHVLATGDVEHQVVDFTPYGYDERQFCSPGFDLPVGRFGRTPHDRYPEYHTSADDLSFVRPDRLGESYTVVKAVVDALEGDGRYRNRRPMGEPQLGRRGLYRSVGGDMDSEATEVALLWVLNQSDGANTLLDVARRSGMSFATVRRAADALLSAELLEPC